MTKLDRLTKADLLDALECIDQHFCPPRPTRQDVKTLKACIRAAQNAGRVSPRLSVLIHAVIDRRKAERHARYLRGDWRKKIA